MAIVTAKKFREIMRCTKPTLKKWEADGMPVIREPHKHKQYDVEACHRWFLTGYFDSLSAEQQAAALRHFERRFEDD